MGKPNRRRKAANVENIVENRKSQYGRQERRSWAPSAGQQTGARLTAPRAGARAQQIGGQAEPTKASHHRPGGRGEGGGGDIGGRQEQDRRPGG